MNDLFNYYYNRIQTTNEQQMILCLTKGKLYFQSISKEISLNWIGFVHSSLTQNCILIELPLPRRLKLHKHPTSSAPDFHHHLHSPYWLEGKNLRNEMLKDTWMLKCSFSTKELNLHWGDMLYIYAWIHLASSSFLSQSHPTVPLDCLSHHLESLMSANCSFLCLIWLLSMSWVAWDITCFVSSGLDVFISLLERVVERSYLLLRMISRLPTISCDCHCLPSLSLPMSP